MELKEIAKTMADKYKEEETKWVLILKKLEATGFQVKAPENPYHYCSRCGRPVKYNLDNIIKGNLYCNHCFLSIKLENPFKEAKNER